MKLVKLRMALAEMLPHSWMYGIAADGIFFPLQDHIGILTWPWDKDRHFGKYLLIGPGYPPIKGRFSSVGSAKVFIQQQAEEDRLRYTKAMERIQEFSKKFADEFIKLMKNTEKESTEAK